MTKGEQIHTLRRALLTKIFFRLRTQLEHGNNKRKLLKWEGTENRHRQSEGKRKL